MPSKDDKQMIGFNVSRDRKRLAAILAAKLSFPNVSELMIFLLDREIDRHFTEDMQRALLLGDPDEIPEKLLTPRRRKA